LDKDVIINEDVWAGINVTVMPGVEIGRGTTIAASSVVTKSIPPYCICAGVPAKFIKFYWDIEEILRHEEMLYPITERYTREQLETIFEKYQK
jgi:serine acetyltransferase